MSQSSEFPTVGQMISSQTLASNIISRHNTENAVLDGNELQTLRRFCSDPSKRSLILHQNDLLDSNGEFIKPPVSLAGYIVHQHDTPSPCLTESEVQELKQWFETTKIPPPTVREMIKYHTLGRNVIIRQNTPDDIFDTAALSTLRAFVEDPSSKEKILRDLGLDHEQAWNATTGDLVAFCIVRDGTEDQILTSHEIEMLRQWFQEGGADVGGVTASL